MNAAERLRVHRAAIHLLLAAQRVVLAVDCVAPQWKRLTAGAHDLILGAAARLDVLEARARARERADSPQPANVRPIDAARRTR